MKPFRLTALLLALVLLLSPLPAAGRAAAPALRLDLPQLSPGRVTLTGEVSGAENTHITLTLTGADGSALTLLDAAMETADVMPVHQSSSQLIPGAVYTAELSAGGVCVTRSFRALPDPLPGGTLSGSTEPGAAVGLYRDGVLVASALADGGGGFTLAYAEPGPCTLRAETGSAVLEEAALVGSALTHTLPDTGAALRAVLPAGYGAAGLAAAARDSGAAALTLTATVEDEATRYREAILLRQAAHVSRLDLLLNVRCSVPLSAPITLFFPVPELLRSETQLQVTRVVGTEVVPLSGDEGFVRVGDTLALRLRTMGLLAVTGVAGPEPGPEVLPTPVPTAPPVRPTPAPTPTPTPTPTPIPVSFTDIQGHWAEDEILLAAGLGLFSGTGDGRFDPEGTMTRAMFVTVLWRIAGEPDPSVPCPFEDVVPGSWYDAAVTWAVETGVVQGRSPQRFDPAGTVTREQMALMLWRFAGSPPASAPPACRDADRIAPWAESAVSWAWETKLLQGSGGYFYPRDAATRAQGAALLLRFFSR